MDAEIKKSQGKATGKKKVKPAAKYEAGAVEEKKVVKADSPSTSGALSEIGKTFSEGADEIADIVLDKNEKEFIQKVKKTKNECVAIFNGVAKVIKKGVKRINAKGVICDTSYQLGRSLKITINTCGGIFNDLME